MLLPKGVGAEREGSYKDVGAFSPVKGSELPHQYSGMTHGRAKLSKPVGRTMLFFI